ncbi:hypothetical protein FB45DRAFT_898306 [Roridomyces roridus]|uniref:F-box domain-containing protein n=1 Tax=Roridomyces roridus TaxID=1738132 RepID=A0AAD7FV83_9AGAR|nr:hypothetical protein FB45DRAFT_898306 [Roridomyces roridus]
MEDISSVLLGQSSSDVLKQTAAPIHELPAELLVEIFRVVAAQAGEATHPRRTSYNELKPVLALSEVCGRWRQLVCTTPHLWNFQVGLSLKKAPSDTYLATTKTFFERSAPLLIPILWREETPEASPLSLVFWESDISRLYTLPTDALKNLISLDLRHWDETSDYTPLKVFLGAHIPWPQLVTLRLQISDYESAPAQEFIQILAQCPNLVSVEFLGMTPWSQPAGPSTPVIRLAQLTTLELDFDLEISEGLITPFLAHLDLPALKNVYIGSGINVHWSSADLTAFLHRSPNIEDLDISYSLMTSDNLSSLLANVPSLVALRLHQCFDFVGAFQATFGYLTFSPTAPGHPAPRLQRLTLLDDGEIDEEQLERMISSRWWTDAELAALAVAPPVARWEQVHIGTDFYLPDGEQRKYSDQLTTRMVQLQAQGLDLELK